MIARKILIASCAAALTTSPAWAHAGGGSGDAPRGDGQGQQHGRGHGRSHRCTPRGVAYVAAGTLSGHTLVLDAAGAADKPTYSGDVTIDVAKGNKAAKGDKRTQKTYTLDHARVVLGLDDQNADGRVDLGDVLPGSRAKVIGKVTKLNRRCDQTGFTPELKIRKLIVHAPQAAD